MQVEEPSHLLFVPAFLTCLSFVMRVLFPLSCIPFLSTSDLFVCVGAASCASLTYSERCARLFFVTWPLAPLSLVARVLSVSAMRSLPVLACFRLVCGRCMFLRWCVRLAIMSVGMFLIFLHPTYCRCLVFCVCLVRPVVGLPTRRAAL